MAPLLFRALRSSYLRSPITSADRSSRPFLSYFVNALRYYSRYCPLQDEQRCVVKGEVAVFWDLNVSNVPETVDPHCISLNIMHALRRNGFSGPITINAYGNTRSLNDQTFLQALVSTGVDLHHVPGGVKDLNSRLLVDLLLWVKENLPPANLLLISRDKNFSSVMHKLQMRGYDVFWAYPDEEISSVLLGLSSKVWAWESVIRGLGVERSSTSPVQVGSGRLPRYSIQHPELDIKRDLCNSDTPKISKVGNGVPKEVVEKLLNIIKLRPNGFTLPALRRQLMKSNMVLDKDLYGHKDLLAFLLSIPELKASLVWTTDRTRTYVFTETGSGSTGIKGDSDVRLHPEKKSTTGSLKQMEDATCGKHVVELSASHQQQRLLKNQVANDECASQQQECMQKNLAENLTSKVTMSSKCKSISNGGLNFLRRLTKFLRFSKSKQTAAFQDGINQGSMECSSSSYAMVENSKVDIKSKTDCKRNSNTHRPEDSKSVDVKGVTKPLSLDKSIYNRTLQHGIPRIRQGSMDCALNKIAGNSEIVADNIKFKTDCKNNSKIHCAEDPKSIDIKEAATLLKFGESKQNGTLQDGILCIRQDFMEGSTPNESVGNSEAVTDNIRSKTDCGKSSNTYCTEDSKRIDVKKMEIWATERRSGLDMEEVRKDDIPSNYSIVGPREIYQNKIRQVVEVLEWRDAMYNDNSVENRQCVTKNAVDAKVGIDETPEKTMISNMENSNNNLSFRISIDEVWKDESIENIQSIWRENEQGKSQISEENLTEYMDGNGSSSKHVSKFETHRTDTVAKQRQSHQSVSRKTSKVTAHSECDS